MTAESRERLDIWLRRLHALVTSPFRAIGAAIMWAVNFNSGQIRALMCWGMLFGVAVLGFTNIFHTHLAQSAMEGGENYGPFLGLVIEQIRYNSILQAVMVLGVVAIAIQANAFKAKIGDMVDIDATIREAATAQVAATANQQGPSADGAGV